jgi:hypothetical protein
MATQLIYPCFKITLAHPIWDIPFTPETDPFQTALKNTGRFIGRIGLFSGLVFLTLKPTVQFFSNNPSLLNRVIEIEMGLYGGVASSFILTFILKFNVLRAIPPREKLGRACAIAHDVSRLSFVLSILTACTFLVSEKLAKNLKLSRISYTILAPSIGFFLISNAIMNFMYDHLTRAERETH